MSFRACFRYPVFYYDAYDLDMTLISSEHQSRPTRVELFGVNVRPVFEQKPHHLDVALLSGPHQGRRAVVIFFIYVGSGAVFEQKPHYLDVASLSGPH